LRVYASRSVWVWQSAVSWRRRPRAVQTACRRLLRSPDRRAFVAHFCRGPHDGRNPETASAGALTRSCSARLAHVHRGVADRLAPGDPHPAVPVGEFSPSTRVSGHLLFFRPNSQIPPLPPSLSIISPPTPDVGDASTPHYTHTHTHTHTSIHTRARERSPYRLQLFFIFWLIYYYLYVILRRTS